MTFTLVVPALLCLLPVLCFLLALVSLDGYKLVRPSAILAVMTGGMVMAVVSYFLNEWLLQHLGLERLQITRYVSPPIEEGLKGLIILWLIRRHRIGFLVDAAIAGFAVGCGFALVENLYVLWSVPDAGLPTWIVRGFGTAIMHGGATAMIALVALAMLERDEHRGLRAALPGFAAAVLLHSGFNHLNHAPKLATLAALIAVPILLLAAYHQSERTLAAWLSHGFDADAEMLELLHSGRLSDSPVGQYLRSLKARFNGPVLADLLCYLGLFTELALRAKGFLMMRENGFEPTIDQETRAKFAEIRYLERSIGRTGLLALQPLLPMRRKALWQLYLLRG